MLGLCLLALAAATPRPLPEAFLLGGIQVNEARHDQWTARLQESGFNTLAVTVYARQGDWDSAHLWWSEEEPAVQSEVRAAKARGLRVVLVLRLALDHAFPRNQHLWHGQVYPRTEASARAWLANYRRFVRKWARWAQAEGVDVLAVGSELNALTSTRDDSDPVRKLARWMLDEEAQAHFRARLLRHAEEIRPRHLRGHGVRDAEAFFEWLDDKARAERQWAKAVLHFDALNPTKARRARQDVLQKGWEAIAQTARASFEGPVGYAANFDQYQGVGFWSSLDFVGVNAYFTLRSFRSPATEVQLEKGWADAFVALERELSAAGVRDRPVVFTELGLTRRAGTTLAPWAMDGLHLLADGAEDRLLLPADAPEAPMERTRALRALARHIERSDGSRVRLGGALWWKLTTKIFHLPYEPYALLIGTGDPAEKALRRLRSVAEGRSNPNPVR